MARCVYKYEVPPGFSRSMTDIPVGAEFVHVACQDHSEKVFVWALVDPLAPTESVKLGYVPTGQQVPDEAEYVGTALSMGGTFVWHIFVERQR